MKYTALFVLVSLVLACGGTDDPAPITDQPAPLVAGPGTVAAPDGDREGGWHFLTSLPARSRLALAGNFPLSLSPLEPLGGKYVALKPCSSLTTVTSTVIFTLD